MGLNIGVQITRKCNLRCAHCYVRLDGSRMSLHVFREIADYAVQHGGAVGMTGGEVLSHPEIDEFIRILDERRLKYTMVSNGWALPEVYNRLRDSLGGLQRVYLSVDGATEGTHDATRGGGSYRRVVTAAGFCKALGIPFSVQTAVTRRNVHDLEAIALLAATLGACGVNIGPVQPTPQGVADGLVLSPTQFRFVLEEIARLKAVFRMPITPGVGFFCDDPMVMCDPLTTETLFVNADGKAGFCCVLADYREGSDRDLIGDVLDDGLAEIRRRMIDRVAAYREIKAKLVESGAFGALDHANCWYCLKHFGKVTWLADQDCGRWSDDVRRGTGAPVAEEDAASAGRGSDRTWRASADAEFVPLAGDEGVLVHVGRGLSYKLNQTGLRIWKGVRAGNDVNAIAADLTREFDVEEQVAGETIARFLEELRVLGFVEE